MIAKLDAAFPVVLKWTSLGGLVCLLLLWGITALVNGPPGLIPPAVLVAPLGTVLAASLGASAVRDLGEKK